MKKTKFYIGLLCMGSMLISCSEDKLDPNSVFVDSDTEKNELDNWIFKNFTENYNIDVIYKYVDGESDMDYNLSPASFESSVRMTKLVKYMALDPYDEVTKSKEFIRSYFPKIFNYIGSPAYRNNGTMVLGTAEGGRKITMYNLNALNATSGKDIEYLNKMYFHTIHHEFAHILNQIKPYTTSFREISGNMYIQDSWSDEYKVDADAIADGFISPYSSKEDREDFVEVLSFYITLSPEQWTERVELGGDEGQTKIEAKLEIVRTYMMDSWNIDIDQLRDAILKRQKDLPSFDQLTLK